MSESEYEVPWTVLTTDEVAQGAYPLPACLTLSPIEVVQIDDYTWRATPHAAGTAPTSTE